MRDTVDLAVVGGGIVGLAHALLAAQSGASVAVIEARGRPVGASIRNFGLVTVTGQQRGDIWELSGRSRDLWSVMAQDAGVPILQRGMLVSAQTEEAEATLDAFAATEMGEPCARISAEEARRKLPLLRAGAIRSAIWSPTELRVEPREAIPAFVRRLANLPRVHLCFGDPAAHIEPGRIRTLSGVNIRARAIVVCTGADIRALHPTLARRLEMSLTRLNMMRFRPRSGAATLDAPAVSDLTLVRYQGFANLPAAGPLLTRLKREQSEMLDDGIHIIAVRSADGTLVLGDSHHPCDQDTDDPFQSAETDARILRAANDFLDLDGGEIVERWTGAYVAAPRSDLVIEELAPGVTAAVIIGGKGMTMSFGFAERVLQQTIGLSPMTIPAGHKAT